MRGRASANEEEELKLLKAGRTAASRCAAGVEVEDATLEKVCIRGLARLAMEG